MKGQTGNPRGRPRENEDVRAAAREHTAEAIARLADWMRSDDPRASIAGCTALLARGWGQPSQPMDHTGTLTLEQLVLASMERRSGAK